MGSLFRERERFSSAPGEPPALQVVSPNGPSALGAPGPPLVAGEHVEGPDSSTGFRYGEWHPPPGREELMEFLEKGRIVTCQGRGCTKTPSLGKELPKADKSKKWETGQEPERHEENLLQTCEGNQGLATSGLAQAPPQGAGLDLVPTRIGGGSSPKAGITPSDQ